MTRTTATRFSWLNRLYRPDRPAKETPSGKADETRVVAPQGANLDPDRGRPRRGREGKASAAGSREVATHLSAPGRINSHHREPVQLAEPAVHTGVVSPQVWTLDSDRGR